MKRKKKFLQIVRQEFDDTLNDYESIYANIQLQANEHINKNDVILTYAQSDLLHSFLEAAYIGVDEAGNLYEPETP